jgi:DNA-binding NtrC family response regulator
MNRPRILCVHDAVEKLRLLQGTLEDAGYEVFSAANADMALQILRTASIDAVVLDYDIEAPGGVSLRYRIAHMRPDLPLLMISDVRELRMVPLAALRSYLRHPAPPDALFAAIKETLAPTR